MFDYIGIISAILGIVDFLARFIGRFLKGKVDGELEESVIEFLAQNRGWASPKLVWVKLCLGPLIEDIPLDVAFPPPLKGWPKIRWWFQNLWIEIRHRWRKWSRLVPEGTITSVMHLRRGSSACGLNPGVPGISNALCAPNSAMTISFV